MGLRTDRLVAIAVRLARPRYLLLALSLCLFGFLCWLATPAYLVLPWPVEDRWIWDHSWAKTTTIVGGPIGWHYVHRQTGHIPPGGIPWKTDEEIHNHFKRWLVARGWESALCGGALTYCIMPEAYLLPDGSPMIRCYERASPPFRGDRVFVMVYPHFHEGMPSGYSICLATACPSLRCRFIQIEESRFGD